MSYIKVSLGFTRISDHGLENAANEVLAGMTGNLHYPTPPVSMEDLRAAVEAFSAALAARWAGGPPATSDKNDKRNALIGILLKLGCYVQIAAENDRTVILNSGFKVVDSSHHPAAPLTPPRMIEILNGARGELIVKAQPVRRARVYEVRYTLAEVQPVIWQPAMFLNPQAMRITSLSSGSNYTLQVRAIGGSTTSSDWSDPSTHMSL